MTLFTFLFVILLLSFFHVLSHSHFMRQLSEDAARVEGGERSDERVNKREREREEVEVRKQNQVDKRGKNMNASARVFSVWVIE